MGPQTVKRTIKVCLLPAAALIFVAAWMLFGRAEEQSPGLERQGQAGSRPSDGKPLQATPQALLSAAPSRTPVPVRPTRLQLEDEDGRPVADADVWSEKPGSGTSAAPRTRLAVSDEHGIAAPVIADASAAIAITASGYLDRKLTVAPMAHMRIVLQRAYLLEIACADLAGRPLSGILVAVAPSAIGTEWLEGAAEQATPAHAQDGDPYVAATDSAGVARFADVPRFTVHWRVHTDQHALVAGPGIDDGEPITIPGRYRFRFAPLIAAGFVVEGDRFAGVRKLDMPGANLLPVDRGGAAHRAKADLHARFPKADFLEVMAARDPTALGEFVVDAMLAQAGPRAIAVHWASLADFRERGPQVVQVAPPPGGKKDSLVGTLLVRLCNPDGHELKGRGLICHGGNGFFEVMTGTPREAPVGQYRVTPRDEAVQGYLQRPLLVDVVVSGSEVTWTLQMPLWLVRFRRPPDAPGTPSVVVRNAQGGYVSELIRTGENYVDMLLPEKPLTACVHMFKRKGPDVRFEPQRPTAPDAAPLTIQLKE